MPPGEEHSAVCEHWEGQGDWKLGRGAASGGQHRGILENFGGRKHFWQGTWGRQGNFGVGWQAQLRSQDGGSAN